MRNTTFTRLLPVCGAVALLAVAGCESGESFSCAENPRVCAYAAEVARGLDERAGLELSPQVILSGASANANTIRVTYDVIYPRHQLGGGDIQVARTIAYGSLVRSFCRPESQLFLVEGGQLRLTVYSSDSKPLASAFVDRCPSRPAGGGDNAG